MRLRAYLAALAVTIGSAASMFALSAEFLDWGRGPAQFLMTRDETAIRRALLGSPRSDARHAAQRIP
jgi:hypothetical protein